MSFPFIGESIDMDKKSISFDINVINKFFEGAFGLDVELQSIDAYGFVNMLIGKKYNSTGAYIKNNDGSLEFKLWVLHQNAPYYAEGFTFMFQNTLSELWLLEEPTNFFIEPDALTSQFVGITDSGLHDGYLINDLHRGEILRRFIKINPLEYEVSYQHDFSLLYESRIPEVRDWVNELLNYD